MHIYAFGSICRGEVSSTSDVDLLALVQHEDNRFDPQTFSIYSYSRIETIWLEGNPFSWHLFLESRFLFGDDGKDFLAGLRCPNRYVNGTQDCEKFFSLFQDARRSLLSSPNKNVFDLAVVFLSIRNLATCYSLSVTARPDFSRHSALRLGSESLHLSPAVYRTLEEARMLCTRGLGDPPSQKAITDAIAELDQVSDWMHGLIQKVRNP